MLEYSGMAKASLAWLAWREGDEPTAQANGATAVELWQQAALSTPFQWTARFPLAAAGLAQNRLADAIGHAQVVLQPEQQRLPPALTQRLEQATAAWQQGDSAAAGACLGQALDLAQELGFL
jgi:tetratricopeptide (TPR) repeat protein